MTRDSPAAAKLDLRDICTWILAWGIWGTTREHVEDSARAAGNSLPTVAADGAR